MIITFTFFWFNMIFLRSIAYLFLVCLPFVINAEDAYQCVEIPPMEGFSQVYPIAINNKGTVVGIMLSNDESSSTAFIWDKTKGTRTIPFFNKQYLYIVPRAINDQNQVVGIAAKQNNRIHSFLWTEEKGVTILPANLKSPFLAANAINNRGDIAGSTLLVIPGHAEDENYYIPSAFIYRNKEFLIPLEKSEGEDFPLFSTGISINEDGWLIGSYLNIEDFTSQPSEDFITALAKGDLNPNKIQNTKIFKWNGKEIIKLKKSDQHINVVPRAINNLGAFIASASLLNLPLKSSFYVSQQQACSEIDVVPEDIEFCDKINVQATGMNDKGEVIGTSFMLNEDEDHMPKPFIWTAQKSTVNINNLLNKNSKCLYFFHAQAINQTGQIIGYGLRNDHSIGGFILNKK